MPKNVCSSHLFSNSLLRKILQYQEKNFFFHGLIHSIKTKKIGLEILKKDKGYSAYNLTKYANVFFKVLFYNTTFPLYFIFWLGVFFVISSFLFIILILVNTFIFDFTYYLGWPSVVVLIIFFGGLAQMSIGVIGLYISYIFEEIKKRPVLVKKID